MTIFLAVQTVWFLDYSNETKLLDLLDVLMHIEAKLVYIPKSTATKPCPVESIIL